MKKICAHSHFSIVKFDNGASDYCLKETGRLFGPWEFGLKPARRNVAGDCAARNKKILEIGAAACVDQGLIPLKDYARLKMCINLYQLDTAPKIHHPNVRGIWIFGVAGAGKSHYARTNYPDHFIKSQNRWWDGYAG